eukprot:6173602-Pleurochrysis_carterae.AAC.1
MMITFRQTTVEAADFRLHVHTRSPIVHMLVLKAVQGSWFCCHFSCRCGRRKSIRVGQRTSPALCCPRREAARAAVYCSAAARRFE